jgi:DNA/RNA endonuclease YhcR with UshA esterase domain
LQPFRFEARLIGIQGVFHESIEGVRMRSFIVVAMFVASSAQAGWSDYEEVRDLDLDASGISELSIVAGAGSMDVIGVEGADRITVKATIVVPDEDEEGALRVIEKRMILSLERNGDRAELDSEFDHGLFNFGSSGYIALEVSVPQGMAVSINDGSGSIDVMDIVGDVTIDDGSGSIDVSNVANLKIDDGSGSIDVITASGDVSIVDGSGSITVKHVAGSVTVDDGSGSIRVSDVEHDLTILESGSGSVNFSDVRGTVDQET